MPTDATVILTTLGSEDEAAAFIRTLLDRRLIACGTILPGARSLYRWEDQVADEREAVVLLKSTTQRLDALAEAFSELHPTRCQSSWRCRCRRGSKRISGGSAGRPTPTVQRLNDSGMSRIDADSRFR